MSQAPEPSPEEIRDASRFAMMNMARIFSIIFVVLGIAAANEKIDVPYWLGVAAAVAGLFGFFYGPRMLVRRWKAMDAQGDPE